MNMDHLDYVTVVQAEDKTEIDRKEQTYRGSWKKRGGVGAFMMLARKWDRIEEMVRSNYEEGNWPDWLDLFKVVQEQNYAIDDGSLLAEIRDLRRYLTLVEAEILAQRNANDKDPYTHRAMQRLAKENQEVQSSIRPRDEGLLRDPLPPPKPECTCSVNSNNPGTIHSAFCQLYKGV